RGVSFRTLRRGLRVRGGISVVLSASALAILGTGVRLRGLALPGYGSLAERLHGRCDVGFSGGLDRVATLFMGLACTVLKTMQKVSPYRQARQAPSQCHDPILIFYCSTIWPAIWLPWPRWPGIELLNLRVNSGGNRFTKLN